MPWGRLDDSLYDHPKLDGLGEDRLAALGLWVSAISWSNRHLTDGHVSSSRIGLLGGTPALADLLVTAGLFDGVEGGYQVHDFLEFNEARSVVESRRDADRTRKRLLRESEQSPAGVRPEVNGSPDGPPARAGTRPLPSPVPSSRPVPRAPAPAPARGGTVDRDPLLREIREAYIAADKADARPRAEDDL